MGDGVKSWGIEKGSVAHMKSKASNVVEVDVHRWGRVEPQQILYVERDVDANKS